MLEIIFWGIVIGLAMLGYYKTFGEWIREIIHVRMGYIKYLQFLTNGQIREGWIKPVGKTIQLGGAVKNINLSSEYVRYENNVPILFFDADMNQLKINDLEIKTSELSKSDVENLVRRAYWVGKSFASLVQDKGFMLLYILLLLVLLGAVGINFYLGFENKKVLDALAAQLNNLKSVAVNNSIIVK